MHEDIDDHPEGETMPGDRIYTLYTVTDGAKTEVLTKKFKSHDPANDWFQKYRKEHPLPQGTHYQFSQTGAD